MRARRAAAAFLSLLVGTLVAATGCAQPQLDARLQLWKHGRLTVGTGPTNGVFNQLGSGYADVVNRHLTGFEAVAMPTNGASENLQRLVRGDIDVGFTFADVAGDAVAGKGSFAGSPVEVRALARLFTAYTHVVVRSDAGIRSLADLEGKRVATGPAGSGTEIMALRVLTAAGLDPDKDVRRVTASLSQMTSAFAARQLDAFFYTAGLPVVGITALFAKLPGQVAFLRADAVLPALEKAYPGVYTAASIPQSAYGLAADVPTVAVPALLVVSPSMPVEVAYELTRLLFEHQDELAAVHPEGKNIDRGVAAKTDPVLLHPGARGYYGV
ncbi:MAG: TAXI family TRAP transporter solute-binding subunit [Hamadaea sp.]|uniref:TAXI family TRAP transporter solute-binding subunit n=1 Tax=Hamadaea sp. TaxID=2024425 RepID=UPI001855FEC2|nr:TAXI family TRAP transporter solute-binding subunit [Hamadaea sp.]NUR74258.1 TAXI family TRAP transporter solute-binding subunit [Hamadaea sp.]NUT22975.1 TAXI family TRAP transporter solute-binding subunit [Hamadaea sp.]